MTCGLRKRFSGKRVADQIARVTDANCPTCVEQLALHFYDIESVRDANAVNSDPMIGSYHDKQLSKLTLQAGPRGQADDLQAPRVDGILACTTYPVCVAQGLDCLYSGSVAPLLEALLTFLLAKSTGDSNRCNCGRWARPKRVLRVGNYAKVIPTSRTRAKPEMR